MTRTQAFDGKGAVAIGKCGPADEARQCYRGRFRIMRSSGGQEVTGVTDEGDTPWVESPIPEDIYLYLSDWRIPGAQHDQARAIAERLVRFLIRTAAPEKA